MPDRVSSLFRYLNFLPFSPIEEARNGIKDSRIKSNRFYYNYIVVNVMGNILRLAGRVSNNTKKNYLWKRTLDHSLYINWWNHDDQDVHLYILNDCYFEVFVNFKAKSWYFSIFLNRHYDWSFGMILAFSESFRPFLKLQNQ